MHTAYSENPITLGRLHAKTVQWCEKNKAQEAATKTEIKNNRIEAMRLYIEEKTARINDVFIEKKAVAFDAALLWQVSYGIGYKQGLQDKEGEQYIRTLLDRGVFPVFLKPIIPLPDSDRMKWILLALPYQIPSMIQQFSEFDFAAKDFSYLTQFKNKELCKKCQQILVQKQDIPFNQAPISEMPRLIPEDMCKRDDMFRRIGLPSQTGFVKTY